MWGGCIHVRRWPPWRPGVMRRSAHVPIRGVCGSAVIFCLLRSMLSAGPGAGSDAPSLQVAVHVQLTPGKSPPGIVGAGACGGNDTLACKTGLAADFGGMGQQPGAQSDVL